MTARTHGFGWMISEILISLVIFLVITLYLNMNEYVISTRSPPYDRIQIACTQGDVATKAATVIANYSNNHNVFLQLSDYFWEQKTSLYKLPYGTSGSELLIMETLALAHHYHIPPEIDRLQCRRCVVVGNSYRMKNSSLGDIIDRYDVVIRLNNAPVHRFEKDVGTKTTMRLFYPESAYFDMTLDNNQETLMVLVPFKNLDVEWLKTILKDEKRIKRGFWRSPPSIWSANPENLRIMNPYFMEVAALRLLEYDRTPKKKKQQLKLIKPTTGLMAISFAIHFCDMVHIAGFGYPEPRLKTQPIHYYDHMTLRYMSASEHAVPLEAIAIKKLLQHNIIYNLTFF